MEQKETYDNKAVILKKAKAAGEVRQVQQDYLVDVIMTWIQKEMERG